jgi:hypothetical protein
LILIVKSVLCCERYMLRLKKTVFVTETVWLEGPRIKFRWGEIFRTRPDWPWGPPSLLYIGYRVSFPGVKRLKRGVDHPPASNAEVKGRVEVYLFSPFGRLSLVFG